MSVEETVTISKKEYVNLLLSDKKLHMLECGGVDNWEWYGESLNPEDEESFSDYKDKLKAEILGE